MRRHLRIRLASPRSIAGTHHRRPRPATRRGAGPAREPLARIAVSPRAAGRGRGGDRRRLRGAGGGLREGAAADVGERLRAVDAAAGRQGDGAVRPRRRAAAQDHARRGAEALPGGHARRPGRVAGGGLRDQRRPAQPPRGAAAVAGADPAAGARPGKRPHPCLAGVAGRTVPVHRRPGRGADDPLEARRARRRQGGVGGAPRPRRRGDVVDEHLLGSSGSRRSAIWRAR